MSVARLKKAFTHIPEKLTEAVGFVVAIAGQQRKINRLKFDAKKKIEEINATLNKEVKKLTVERDTYFTALFAFAQSKKNELTKDTRSIKLTSGVFGWRWTPPAVVLPEAMTDAEAVKRLEREGLTEYVRVVKEIDREALLRDRPEIAFVTYEQREEFFVKPKLLKGEGRAEELKTEAIDVVE